MHADGREMLPTAHLRAGETATTTAVHHPYAPPLPSPALSPLQLEQVGRRAAVGLHVSGERPPPGARFYPVKAAGAAGAGDDASCDDASCDGAGLLLEHRNGRVVALLFVWRLFSRALSGGGRKLWALLIGSVHSSVLGDR